MKQLTENAVALVQELIAKRPTSTKGTYVKTVTVSSTMGPGVRVDPNTVTAAVEEAA